MARSRPLYRRLDPELALTPEATGTFESDVLLPAQLACGARQDSQVSGPRALMLALLSDAIRCLLRPRGTRRCVADAEAWIRTEDPEWPASFRNVCEVLGFDADRLRAALLARAAALETPAAPRRNAWRIELRRSRPGGPSPRRERPRRNQIRGAIAC